jgi:UDPglucose 6-dehydrogenase
MPEFLTEKNWRKDTFDCSEWFIGVDNNSQNAIQKIQTMFSLSSLVFGTDRKLTIVSTRVAESIKYFRNCFLATKVAFCNEFYQLCQAQNIDYSMVAMLATNDQRIGSSHSIVPGPDGCFGFGGTCFPEDMASLDYQMKQLHVENPVIQAAISRNNTIDRTQKDWQQDQGRAVI